MEKTVVPKRYSFLTKFDPDQKNKLPDINWKELFEDMTAMQIKYAEVTITEVVDWDKAPMRRYLHGVQIPAFTKKFNETCKHPAGGHFHTSEIKDFLKAKFLGWNKESEGYKKWADALSLQKPIVDIFAFLKIQQLNSNLDVPVEINSTEKSTPEEYMIFINDGEAYYFELFQEMYDTRTSPNNNNLS